ncbi:glycosyltransferase family 2 protein [Sulfitobacter sp.]|uniref:glycosyltransferase family 2 protein n=1 Tax=Sulfitobacter sp. TaxID=1903071 RepID=UPI003567E6EE
MSDLGLQYTSPEPASPVRKRVLLGRILVNADLIDQADLVLALEHQRTINVPLGELLVAQGLITPTQVSQALAIQHQLQLVDLVADPPKPTMGKHISAQDCLRLGIVPWRSVGNIVLVATSTPDKFVQFNHDLAASGISFLPVIADERQIKQAITEVYGAELAQRAATRVPPVESCRTWRVDRRDRRAWAFGVLSLLSTLIILQPAWTFTIIILWALCTSILTVSLRSLAFFARLFLCDDPPATARMTGIATGLATREKLQLPRVSVLVPLLHEKEIATALIARLTRLTYPKSLLQIVLVLEEGDAMTRETIARTTLPSWFDVIEVPQANRLRTKPRALNYALDFCNGSIIGVWDAEDAPEVDQIDRIVEHFAHAPQNVVCVQGVLDYYNARTNWISRCFTIEYASWWRVILPGIARLGLIIPLGGTTLFFRRDVLEDLCGWDAHNVTEDADLGVRLARHGFKTDLLPTVTYEEANFRAWPWVKQRSRWLKGFLITWCVHMRNPVKLLQEVGFARFLGIQTLFLATFNQFICAPLLWSFCLTLVGFSHPIEITLGTKVLTWLFYFFVFAEILNISIAFKAASRAEHRHLLPWVVTLPLYFILGTFAAYKALYEFVVSPFYWDKTEHGVTAKSGKSPKKA